MPTPYLLAIFHFKLTSLCDSIDKMKSSSRQVEWTLSSLSAVVLAAIVIFEASAFQRTTSATFDETTYLQLAADVQQRADFSRLVELGVAPLPILLAWSIPARLGSVEPPSPDIYPTQVRQARRIATLLFTVPLVLLAQLWLARRRGWFTGLIGGGLLALSPNILANG